jgi:hypothetical protein
MFGCPTRRWSVVEWILTTPIFSGSPPVSPIAAAPESPSRYNLRPRKPVSYAEPPAEDDDSGDSSWSTTVTPN